MKLTKRRLERLKRGDPALTHLVFRYQDLNRSKRDINALANALKNNSVVTHVRIEGSIGYLGKDDYDKLTVNKKKKLQRLIDEDDIAVSINKIIENCSSLKYLRLGPTFSQVQALSIFQQILKTKPENLAVIEINVENMAFLDKIVTELSTTNLQMIRVNGNEDPIKSVGSQKKTMPTQGSYATLIGQQYRPLETVWSNESQSVWPQTYRQLTAAAVKDCVAYHQKQPANRGLNKLYRFLCDRREEISEQGGFFDGVSGIKTRHRVFTEVEGNRLAFGALRDTSVAHNNKYSAITPISATNGPYASIYDLLKQLFRTNCNQQSQEISFKQNNVSYTTVVFFQDTLNIAHSRANIIEPLLTQAEDHFKQLLEASEQDECIDQIVSIVFLYSQAMPTERGNAAITEMLMRAIGEIKGYELSYTDDISMDLYALFNTSIENFIEAVKPKLTVTLNAQAQSTSSSNSGDSDKDNIESKTDKQQSDLLEPDNDGSSLQIKPKDSN